MELLLVKQRIVGLKLHLDNNMLSIRYYKIWTSESNEDGPPSEYWKVVFFAKERRRVQNVIKAEVCRKKTIRGKIKTIFFL